MQSSPCLRTRRHWQDCWYSPPRHVAILQMQAIGIEASSGSAHWDAAHAWSIGDTGQQDRGLSRTFSENRARSIWLNRPKSSILFLGRIMQNWLHPMYSSQPNLRKVRTPFIYGDHIFAAS